MMVKLEMFVRPVVIALKVLRLLRHVRRENIQCLKVSFQVGFYKSTWNSAIQEILQVYFTNFIMIAIPISKSSPYYHEVVCHPSMNYYTVAISEDNCTDCPEGKFCSGLSSTGYTGNCSAGYYCTGGASTSTQNHAEPGYYAEVGAFDQTECPKGRLE